MTQEQIAYVESTIQKAKVDDIGCGHSRLRSLTESYDYLGIDMEPLRAPKTIEFDLAKPCPHLRHDIAFVSWPINRRSIAWHLFLRKYKEIIYIGKNTDGIVCGDPEFWDIVSGREILKVLPDPSETLIHYGPNPRTEGTPAPLEEVAAKATWKEGKIVRYPKIRLKAR